STQQRLCAIRSMEPEPGVAGQVERPRVLRSILEKAKRGEGPALRELHRDVGQRIRGRTLRPVGRFVPGADLHGLRAALDEEREPQQQGLHVPNPTRWTGWFEEGPQRVDSVPNSNEGFSE